MKILYGIQGTGNGHISKAETIYPILKQYGEVDVMVSANNFSLTPSFPIHFHKTGISFVTINGKVDYWASLKALNIWAFVRDLNTFPFKYYDLVVSDFEPLSAWGAKLKGVPSLQISHQASFYCKKTPRPATKNWIAELIIKYFAPADDYIGIHFERYSEKISEPIIKKHLFSIQTSEKKHITVYLPYDADLTLLKVFSEFKDFQFHVFKPSIKTEYRQENVQFRVVSDQGFSDSLSSSFGVICNAGFETPAEALFLGKRLLVIPLGNQYEQECNASALKRFGVTVLKTLDIKHKNRIVQWMDSEPSKVSFGHSMSELIGQSIGGLTLSKL